MPLPLVALETTLLLHGVPRGAGAPLARDLGAVVRAHGAEPAFVGVVSGRAVAGLTDAELGCLFASPAVPKANTSNLGVFIHRRQSAATTVSATLELAAGAGVRVLATGGLGGVHRGYGVHLDISADLAALARFPVAVVCSGAKSILDVGATREALETLGIPVVGYGTDRFPEFYVRGRDVPVDARFDDAADLGAFVASELRRSGRGVVIANPIPPEDEVAPHRLEAWLAEAQRLSAAKAGRDRSPAVLEALHRVSGGKTLEANIALVRANAALAARLAVLMAGSPADGARP